MSKAEEYPLWGTPWVTMPQKERFDVALGILQEYAMDQLDPDFLKQYHLGLIQATAQHNREALMRLDLVFMGRLDLLLDQGHIQLDGRSIQRSYFGDQARQIAQLANPEVASQRINTVCTSLCYV